MNDGVAMLLERMKTNPEEFWTDNGSSNKWSHLIHAYITHLSTEDREALNGGIDKIMQQRFTEQVMEELIDPKKSSLEDVINHYRVKGMASVGQTQGLYANGIGGNVTWEAREPLAASLTIGNQTLDESTIEHLKAHVDYIQKQKAKEHKTLFGRLFNYL